MKPIRTLMTSRLSRLCHLECASSDIVTSSSEIWAGDLNSLRVYSSSESESSESDIVPAKIKTHSFDLGCKNESLQVPLGQNTSGKLALNMF